MRQPKPNKSYLALDMQTSLTMHPRTKRFSPFKYHHKPFHQATRFSVGWGTALSLHENGDFHIGLGVVGLYALNERWFVEGSVMPGYFNPSIDLNDLGGDFQIRSLLGLGYALDNGNSVSLAITHKSNASTNDDNPGVNAVLLRYHLGF